MLQFAQNGLRPIKRYAERFLYILGPSGRKGLIPIVLGFIFLAALDLVGLSLIGPLAALATNGEALDTLPGIEGITQALGIESFNDLVFWIGVTIIVAFVSKGFAGFYVNRAIVRFALQHQKDIKLRLLDSYLSLPLEEALQKNSASLLTTIHQHVYLFTNRVMIPVLKGVSELVFLVFLFVFLLVKNPMATSIIGVVFIVIGLVYDAIVKKEISASGADSIRAARASTKIISQSSDGFKEIRVGGKEDFFLLELKKYSDLYARAATYSQSLAVVPRYMIEASVVTFLVCLLIIGLVIYGGPSPELMSMLGIFAFAALRSMSSIHALLSTGSSLRYAQTALFELGRDLKKASAFLRGAANSGTGDGGSELSALDFEEQLCAEDLHYRYPNKNVSAISGISLCIAKGEVIGIIGASGSGKTTLVDLLIGLLQPHMGRVLVDGRDIIANRRVWMDRVAYIPQSVFLLDDTIAANVAFGIPRDEVNSAKVTESLRLAQLGSFIDSLPHGVKSTVGERGARLSGGQRQRIAIARALYERRDLLVMDEATAALDSQTEKEVVETVRALRGAATMILIAHRLTTLRYCDRIYELENGRVLRWGSYQEIVVERAGAGNNG